jgi:hypothetical protein
MPAEIGLETGGTGPFYRSLGAAIQVDRSDAILGGSLGNIFRRQLVSVIERFRRLIKQEYAVMDQQRDREQLERKLEQCRRLSRVASDPATSIRFTKLIEELEHSLQEAE